MHSVWRKVKVNLRLHVHVLHKHTISLNTFIQRQTYMCSQILVWSFLKRDLLIVQELKDWQRHKSLLTDSLHVSLLGWSINGLPFPRDILLNIHRLHVHFEFHPLHVIWFRVQIFLYIIVIVCNDSHVKLSDVSIS